MPYEQIGLTLGTELIRMSGTYYTFLYHNPVSVEWLGYMFSESTQIQLGNRSQKAYYLNTLLYWLASLHHHHNGSKWLYGQILRVQITYWACDLGQDSCSLSASTSSFCKVANDNMVVPTLLSYQGINKLFV